MVASSPTGRVSRTTSFVSLVRAEIERLIARGDLAGGTRINETSLAARLGISRGPVREACRELANTGLLHNEINRGFFVREVSVKQALDIYDLRAMLFGMAARLAANLVTRPQIESLSTLVAAMDDAASRDDIGAYYPLNLQFHEALVAAADNYKLAQLWPLLEAELHLFRRRGLILEGSMRTSNDEHQAILQALVGARHALAGRLAERHIVAGKNRFLRSLDDRGEQPRPTLTVDSLTKPR